MAEQQGERTEKPTAKKLKEARERGQVARSRDLASALSLAGVTLALGWFGFRMFTMVSERMLNGLTTLGDHARGQIEPAGLVTLLWADAGIFARVAVPPALVAGLVSVAASTAQVGFSYSPKAMQLNWARLNPATGFAKLAPAQAGAELAKALIGIAVLGGLSYVLIREIFDQAPVLMGMMPGESARLVSGHLWRLLWRASLALVILGCGDYALQRWRWFSQLKMTRQEVRDEAKHNEGSPEIKARVRRVQREMTRRRMLHAVKTATVVVTNPTHFAVALEYRRDVMAAPLVVAKGQDEVAARIRAVAREHGVPIVENVTLARALFKSAEVGDVIPADLFGAVAEMLAYLVRLKQLVL